MQGDCIFCKIVNKETPAAILFENATYIMFSPPTPIAKGHVLIIPQKHYQDIFDIDTDILLELITIAQKTASDIVREKEATGINLLHASGKDAQQSILHFHLHVVPRYPNDGLDLWLRSKL